MFCVSGAQRWKVQIHFWDKNRQYESRDLGNELGNRADSQPQPMSRVLHILKVLSFWRSCMMA
jgi:hypothetical protein